MFGALRGGASGFLLKGGEPRDLLQAIRTVAAGELQLSPLTAKTHVSRILSKLGARDRVQLVVLAYQSGIA